MKKTSLSILLILITLSARSQLNNENKSVDSLAVRNTVEGFLVAFKNLEFDHFIEFFADDATVFFPSNTFPTHRISGKSEVGKVFEEFFNAVREARGPNKNPPYLNIEPKELEMKLFTNVAMSTFLLGTPPYRARRTIILEKQGDKWLIVHLHASNIAEK